MATRTLLIGLYSTSVPKHLFATLYTCNTFLCLTNAYLAREECIFIFITTLSPTISITPFVNFRINNLQQLVSKIIYLYYVSRYISNIEQTSKLRDLNIFLEVASIVFQWKNFYDNYILIVFLYSQIIKKISLLFIFFRSILNNIYRFLYLLIEQYCLICTNLVDEYREILTECVKLRMDGWTSLSRVRRGVIAKVPGTAHFIINLWLNKSLLFANGRIWNNDIIRRDNRLYRLNILYLLDMLAW